MKRVLCTVGIVTAFIVSLSAQTFTGFPAFQAERFVHQEYTVPGDSSSAQQEFITVAITMADTVGINGVQANFMPASAGVLGPAAAPLSANDKAVAATDFWKKGTKANPQGYVVYIKVPAFPGHGASKLHVRLEGPAGQLSNTFIQQP